MRLMNTVKIKRALLSVSDKSAIVELGQTLSQAGVEMLSTGGTAKTLIQAGLSITHVGDHTGFPEIMDGRVKTLHPKIHGGLLALRDNESHVQAMVDHEIDAIDMLVVNLYPFAETLAKGGDFADCVENIDIGGPAMLRAAAKNFAHVAVITDPADYEIVMKEMAENDGSVTYETRKRLSAKAFAMTAQYDSMISGWLRGQVGVTEAPRHYSVGGQLKDKLRYGENSHQSAALYSYGGKDYGLAGATQHQGKALSYNNINDTNAAYNLVCDFDQPALAIIKHANPCGVAVDADGDMVAAYQKALACDPVSAFGGILALNRPLTADLVAQFGKHFLEVIIAPEVEVGALAALKVKKNLRVLTTPIVKGAAYNGAKHITPVSGGFLLQDFDDAGIAADDLQIVTRRQPTEAELNDMLFAFRVAKHVKSNAIIYAKDGASVGIGAGQMSRVDSSRIAAWKAKEAADGAGLDQSLAIGSVVASDAFFPFADGLLAAAEAGATAVIQPGGSIRDEEVIAAADEHNLAMAFTGRRHFRH